MSEAEGFFEQVVAPVKVAWPASRQEFMTVTCSGQPWSCVLSVGSDGGDRAESGSCVLLDFGKELFGGVRFDVATDSLQKTANVRWCLGESVSEALSGQFNAETKTIGQGEQVETANTGFRFFCIHLLESAASIILTNMRAFCICRQMQREGTFRSSDQLLNGVWETGAYTVHLCMQRLLWDGIKRGQSVWAGDLYPAAMVVAAVFGDHSIVRRSMDLLRSQTGDYDTAPMSWMNSIPGYSLWWIILHRDWYFRFGDICWLEEQHQYLCDLVEMVLSQIGTDGKEQFDGWRYIDWASTHDHNAIHVGLQGQSAWALRSATDLLEVLGENQLASRCTSALETMSRCELPGTRSKQASALLTIGGLAEAVHINQTVLRPDPAEGLTPFLGAAVLEARAMAGDIQGCLELVRNYWGGMIRLGATTFWEDFDIEWMNDSVGITQFPQEVLGDIHADHGRGSAAGLSNSLCHGWSAGPTAWLSRHVLGVEPVKPGCEVIRIVPRLGDLEWVEGSFPTRHGAIHIRHQSQPDGTVRSEIESPPNVEVIRS